CDPSVDAYLARLEALQRWAADRPLVAVGAAPHSVRAVSEEWLARIAEHCADNDLVLHLHADEQPREIAETLAATGLRPIELIERAGALSHHTTIVHGTHCDDAEIALLAGRGATVCACPSTEGNLGDGYVPARRLFHAGVPICVGSDSNTILDPLAEMRELELVARRTAQRRNVLVAEGDDGPAPYLLACGWAHGARALGLPVPVVEAGAPADLIALDLGHAEIAGVADEHLAAAVVMAGSAALVTRTWVAGR
ncbi:MAG: formimidoylglutamate deiminase, partial [Gaiellaceae bacterium]|nr:formimidoylglutamate deiminase [Gaiellaceae bacterium]